MKCIKAILGSKTVEEGHIIRIDDVEAEVRVKTGGWKYVSKSEYKQYRNPDAPKKEEKKKHTTK